jgi:hypothetical protein
VIDGDAQHGYRFVFDANADGDLANDEIHVMRRDGNTWTVEISLRPRNAGHPPLRERIAFDGRVLRAQMDMVRRGTIELDGRALRFAISCEPDCTEPDGVAVGFDLDGDGSVDVTFGSFERYNLSEPDRTIVVGKHTYTFGVSSDGGAVTLNAAADRRPRPSLKVGTLAPDFELAVDGRRHKLSELRGHEVLLDFTAIGCHYCVEDLPWLAATRARGIDVVTIATAATTGDLVDPKHATWVTIEATDPGPIATLYRVRAFPTYFLLDRDGTLVCTRCRHDAIDAVLNASRAGPR